jgi:hypothetical protein
MALHRLNPAMPIKRTPTRRRPVSHAFVVPVVREIAPRPPRAVGAVW